MIEKTSCNVILYGFAVDSFQIRPAHAKLTATIMDDMSLGRSTRRLSKSSEIWQHCFWYWLRFLRVHVPGPETKRNFRIRECTDAFAELDRLRLLARCPSRSQHWPHQATAISRGKPLHIKPISQRMFRLFIIFIFRFLYNFVDVIG
jgi:hypothetical protein